MTGSRERCDPPADEEAGVDRVDMPESLSSSTHFQYPVDDFGSGCSGTGTIGPPLAFRGSTGVGSGADGEETGRNDDGVGGRAGGSIFVILLCADTFS